MVKIMHTLKLIYLNSFFILFFYDVVKYYIHEVAMIMTVGEFMGSEYVFLFVFAFLKAFRIEIFQDLQQL